jgi:hypothetical protein
MFVREYDGFTGRKLMRIQSSASLRAPANVDAEQAVLGAILIKNDIIDAVMRTLSPADFYSLRNGKIYSAMSELKRENIPIDLITLCQRLQSSSTLEDVGGSAYIAGILETTPSAANFTHHVQIVAEMACKRDVLSQLKQIEFDLGASGNLAGIAKRIRDISVKITSDYEKQPSEATYVREFNGGDLQRQAINLDGPSLCYLPVLGQEGFFVRGWSHLLSSYPRVGKTELLVRLVSEWLKEKILYFSEEGKGTWTARLKQIPYVYDHVTIVDALGMTATEIGQRIKEGQETIIIVDTVRNLLGLENENDNSEVARCINPIVLAARATGKTSIVVHHSRKAGGDHGESITGGHAFMGSVDIVLEIKREGREDSYRRLIRGWGRVVEVPKLLYELKSDKKMIVLGSPGQVALDDVANRAYEILRDEWQETTAIEHQFGQPKPSRDQLSKALEKLTTQGRAERDPPITEGQRQGKTYRWRRLQRKFG